MNDGSGQSGRTLDVPTSFGPARAHVHGRTGSAARPVALVLGHGAGGGVGARDLAALARALPARGIVVVLVEQPWRVAGRRVAPAPAQLDTAWLAVVQALREESVGLLVPGGRLVVGGRSAGARVACRTATATGADAVLALAFPLHPPGRPDRSRAPELLAAGVPVTVVQGDRDPFGGPVELRAAGVAAGSVQVVPGADHGFAVGKSAPITQSEALELVVAAGLRACLAG